MGERDEREELYRDTRDDLLKRQLSNSENFDKAILTLSTAALGISLTFTKYVVPLQSAAYLWTLRLSWVLFTLAIISTLCSFLLSQCGIKTQLRHAEKYYLERKDEFLAKGNRAARYTERAAYASAILFVGAIILLVLFVSLNSQGRLT